MSKEKEIEWRKIDDSKSLQSWVLERWRDGTWAHIIPESELRKVKAVNGIALVILIIIWIVVMMLGTMLA